MGSGQRRSRPPGTVDETVLEWGRLGGVGCVPAPGYFLFSFFCVLPTWALASVLQSSSWLGRIHRLLSPPARTHRPRLTMTRTSSTRALRYVHASGPGTRPIDRTDARRVGSRETHGKALVPVHCTYVRTPAARFRGRKKMNAWLVFYFPPSTLRTYKIHRSMKMMYVRTS